MRVPQTRDGSFSTEIFQRYQRSEQGFVLALMEMCLQGVSTRKVTEVTEKLCGVSFLKSTVSDLCVGLDARLNAWRKRPLGDHQLIGSLLADYYDTWQAQDHYFDMTEYWDWKKEFPKNNQAALKVVEIN